MDLPLGQGSVLASTSNACDTMEKVWRVAKCMNFAHNTEFAKGDGFYPFETIEAFGSGVSVLGYSDPTLTDSRIYPSGSECASELGYLSPGQGITWTAGSVLAANEGDGLYPFRNPLGAIYLDVINRIQPGACHNRGIQTGVQVVLSTGVAHNDGVCSNPGCTYQANGTCSR